MDCMYEWFYKKIGGRVFIDLDPIANAYYEIASPWTATGDFEIEVDIYIPDVSAITTASFILGDSAGTNNGLWVNNVGRVLFRDNSGTTLTSNTQPITSGKLHSIKCVKTSGNATIFVDGVEAEPATAFGTVNFDRIGVRSSASFFFDGIIANAKLTDKSGASDVVTTFRLDNSPAAANYTYSTELLDNNTFPDNANARQYLVSSKGWIITDGGAA